MINNVTLVGRITKDPVLETLNSGTKVMRFILAVDRSFKDSSGQRQADFIGCIAYNIQADFISNYIRKGYLMGITGRIQTGAFKNKAGGMTYTSDVIVTTVDSYQPREANTQQPQANPYQGYNNPQYGQQQTPPPDSAYQYDDKDSPF